jgi:hypothetical protein
MGSPKIGKPETLGSPKLGKSSDGKSSSQANATEFEQRLKRAVRDRDHVGRGTRQQGKATRSTIFVHFRFRPLPLSNPSYPTHTAPGCYA